MIKRLLLFIVVLFIIPVHVSARTRFFKVQSIDTMKYSRDLAREKLNDHIFDKEIDTEIKNIAQTGATHVAIDTPYDNEFVPFLKQWVAVVRKYKLHVWFRGNFSGWEEWFGYSKISRKDHIKMTKDFIEQNANLFQDGDIFTPCPECENGGPGDPRQTGDVEGFRRFMIDEFNTTKSSFHTIHKKVASNYASMNGDVARLIMDDATIRAMDDVIAIDHYVKSPEDYRNDLKKFAQRNGGKVKIVLSEFGAPIPDLQGNLSEQSQARWIADVFNEIIAIPQVTGVNYWANKGSSTALWKDNNSQTQAVSVLTSYYTPIQVSGFITDDQGNRVDKVSVSTKNRSTESEGGYYALPVFRKQSVYFHKHGYISININIIEQHEQNIKRDIVIRSIHVNPIRNFLEKMIQTIYSLFRV